MSIFYAKNFVKWNNEQSWTDGFCYILWSVFYEGIELTEINIR